MSQITTGIRAILNNPKVYDFFQHLMGGKSARRELVDRYVRPVTGNRVLDIGCGTGNILDYLPDVEYFGFDLSERYINEASRRYQARGHFKCALVEQETLGGMEPFDIVLAFGLLHHLNDEQALSLMRLACSALHEGGRLVTIDPCFAEGQSLLSRFLVSRDRGQNVRSPKQYRKLACAVFPQAKISGEVRHRLWIPYTHWIMECQK